MSPRTIEASATFELESFDSLKWEVEYEFQVSQEEDGGHREFLRFTGIWLMSLKEGRPHDRMGILMSHRLSDHDRSQLRALCEDHMMEVKV